MHESHPVGRRLIERFDYERTIRIGQEIIRFTPTEYRLLLLLLEDRPVTDREFYTEVFQHQGSDTHARLNLDKHIDNLRLKLRPHGFDVFRVLRYDAYLLLNAS